MSRFHACLIILSAVLTGCGDSSSGQTSSFEDFAHAQETSQTDTSVTTPGSHRTIVGNGSKGPLIDATVELFELDGRGYAIGGAFASTQTDGNGDWELDVNRTDIVLVRVSGGSYVDEADTNIENRRVIELESDQSLESVLLPGQNTVAVTVFTQALLRKSRLETSLNEFDQVIENNRQLFAQAYGFDVLSVLPANPLSPEGDANSVAYAMNVGGVANAINALSISSNSALPEYQHIMDVVADLVDCRLDGTSTGGQQVVNPAIAGYSELTLQQHVLRFRNNNFSAYQNYDPSTVDATPCDQIGGAADTTAPQVTSLASSPVFEALSPDGIQLTDDQISALRSQFVATDDREGELDWTINVPRQLALGVTPLLATVKDAWGNTTNVDWDISVVDSTPPGFSGQESVEAQASGDITIVELERPDVSDRVSAQNQIIVTNDAPDGFPVGQTLVIWTAQDEAGNIATFDQLVTINSVAPIATPPPPVINADSGDVDFSQYFVDPDGTSLTFTIVGLPDGTGLGIDPDTGVLTGTPTLADLMAQPLDVIVSATDGQNTVSVATTVNVAAPNTPPEFTLSQSTLLIEEDFQSVFLQIDPVTVPDSEVDQQVTYRVEFASQTEEDEAPFEVVLDAESLTLELVAKPDANGLATFTVVADDGQLFQNEYSASVSIEVTPVNDPPELTGANDELLLNVGEPFVFSLSSRVIDVDDATLEFVVDQLPAGMSLNPNGEIVGMAVPSDALSDQIDIGITARDAQSESVSFVLSVRVSDPDSDGDGLSDYIEELSGTNPDETDSDFDGFGDSLEFVVNIDTASTSVLFVGVNGDDNSDGLSTATALATLDEVSNRLAQLDANQSAIVLIEQNSEIAGQVLIEGVNRHLLGNVDFESLQFSVIDNASSAPTTILGHSQRVITANNCQSCSLYNLRIENGQGIAISDSDLTLNRVHVVGSRADEGAALWVERSEVNASNLHLALNVAQRGGAIALNENSRVFIRDAVVTGNLANQSGAVASVKNSDLSMANVALTANTAPVAPLIDSFASSVNLANVSAAHNLVKALNSEFLFRCQDEMFEACSDTQSITVSNSVIAGNRNASSETVDLAAITNSGTGNYVEPGRPAAVGNPLSSATPYAVGYISNDPLLINAGTLTAIDAGLEDYFSQVDSAYTDQGLVEPGVHSTSPVTSIDTYRPIPLLSEAHSVLNLRAIDLRLMQDNIAVGSTHRLSVETISNDNRAYVLSVGILPGGPSGTVPAINLGDGLYRVWLSKDFVVGRDLLRLRLDNDNVGVDVLPTCGLQVCSSDGVDGVATGSFELSDERVVPVTASSD